MLPKLSSKFQVNCNPCKFAGNPFNNTVASQPKPAAAPKPKGKGKSKDKQGPQVMTDAGLHTE